MASSPIPHFTLNPDELSFFQQLTGIHDEEKLRQHIIDVQAKAYDIFGYPCIRSFGFLRLKIARLPGYNEALKLLEERKDPILLDIGCCFGNDIRKAVIDGWPVQNVIGSDIEPGFWQYGYELFRSTPGTFPAAFVAGDVFDSAFIVPPAPIASSPLPDLTCLTPLLGKISAIHASSFFHLFSEEQHMIFGQHGAAQVKGTLHATMAGVGATTNENGGNPPVAKTLSMFCHSPESWRKMWVEEVFGGHADRVKVDADLVLVENKDMAKLPVVDGAKEGTQNQLYWLMNWTVTRM
ncbi:hypothetical protein BDZ97DRAFT_1920299 [Flammula alnicola]|nr:hypothetical protein BDZ97DRAFT_1920299 [Flammula alnicola]